MKRLTAAALLIALAGCAPTGGPTPTASASPASRTRQCFPVQSVNGFSPVDRDTINVQVGVNDVYQLDLLGPCNDVDWALAVSLRPRGGGSFICDALDVDVIAPSGLGPQVCRVEAMRKLTAEEAAASRGGRRGS